MFNCRSLAMQNYLRRVAVCMALYIGFILSVGYLFRVAPPSGALAVGCAILPALPILGVFWAIFRLLAEESDEYVQRQLVHQVLFATGFCLCVMTVWQFLQNYDVLPSGNGGFGAMFFWLVGYGLGGIGNIITNKRAKEEE